MDVIKTIQPNAAGAKRYRQKWNEKLVAVRYRKDKTTGRHYTTVELIVDERLPYHTPIDERPVAFQKDGIAAIRLNFDEREVRLKVMACGGQWSVSEKLWYLPLKEVKRLDLEDRVTALNDCYPATLVGK